MQVSLDVFFPFVLPHVAGAAEPIARQAILSAAIEFCTLSLSVQEVDVQAVRAGVAEYDVSVPGGAELAKVMAVYYNKVKLGGRAVEGITDGTAVRGAVDSTTLPAAGTPQLYYQTEPNARSIFLWPVPDATPTSKPLAIRAAFAPSRTATMVDASLYNLWCTVVAAGAIARIQATPGYPFSSTALSEVNRKEFLRGCSDAERKAKTGASTGGLRVAPRSFC